MFRCAWGVSYAVKNGVCVARARIDVPIEEGGLVS